MSDDERERPSPGADAPRSPAGTAPTWRRAAGRTLLVAAGILGSYFLLMYLGKVARASLDPFLMINEDPSAQVYVDGEKITFSGGKTGTYDLAAVGDSYAVEVRQASGTVKRTIHPRGEGSDSGSVCVRKKGVEWNVASE